MKVPSMNTVFIFVFIEGSLEISLEMLPSSHGMIRDELFNKEANKDKLCLPDLYDTTTHSKKTVVPLTNMDLIHSRQSTDDPAVDCDRVCQTSTYLLML